MKYVGTKVTEITGADGLRNNKEKLFYKKSQNLAHNRVFLVDV